MKTADPSLRGKTKPLYSGRIYSGQSKEKVASLLTGIFINFLLVLLLALYRLDVIPEYEGIIVEHGKTQSEPALPPAPKLEPVPSSNEMTISSDTVTSAYQNFNFTMSALKEHETDWTPFVTNWGNDIGAVTQSFYVGERRSLFDKSVNGSGGNLGVVLDVSVSMNRHAKSTERFLTEHFPGAIVLHSQNSSLKNSNSAVVAISKLASIPEIDSILYICDLKDIYNKQGLETVRQALFGGSRTVCFYIITMNRPPSRPLRRLVRSTGGQIYDYSDDFDLTWRAMPAQSSNTSANEAILPLVNFDQ